MPSIILSSYANRIMAGASAILEDSNDDPQHLDPLHAVRSVVSDLYIEVGPSRWDNVNMALVEIAGLYMSQKKLKPAPR